MAEKMKKEQTKKRGPPQANIKDQKNAPLLGGGGKRMKFAAPRKNDHTVIDSYTSFSIVLHLISLSLLGTT